MCAAVITRIRVACSNRPLYTAQFQFQLQFQFHRSALLSALLSAPPTHGHDDHKLQIKIAPKSAFEMCFAPSTDRFMKMLVDRFMKVLAAKHISN